MAHCGNKDTKGRDSGEYSRAWALVETAIFSSRLGSKQHVGSDFSGHTTNKVETQPRPSADRLLKVFMNKVFSAKHIPWQSPAHQRDKKGSTHQQAEKKSLPRGSQHEPHPLESWQQKQEPQCYSLQHGYCNHRKLHKCESTEICPRCRNKIKNPDEQLSEVEIGILPQKRIQSNDSKDVSRSQEKNRGTDLEDIRKV